jgi:hypothetical protein
MEGLVFLFGVVFCAARVVQMEAILTQLAHDRPRAGFMLGGLSAALDEAMRSSAPKLAVACSDVQQNMQLPKCNIACWRLHVARFGYCSTHHAPCNMQRSGGLRSAAPCCA